MKKRNFFIYLLFFSSLYLKNAQAYLDPGSSNLILQIIIAAFASIFVTIKIYWIKIKNLFYKITKKKINLKFKFWQKKT